MFGKGTKASAKEVGGRAKQGGKGNAANLAPSAYHAPFVVPAKDGFMEAGVNADQRMKSKGNA